VAPDSRTDTTLGASRVTNFADERASHFRNHCALSDAAETREIKFG